MPRRNQKNKTTQQITKKQGHGPSGSSWLMCLGFCFLFVFCFLGFTCTFLFFWWNSTELYVFLKFLWFFIKNHRFPQDFPLSTHIMHGLRKSYVNFHIPRRLDVVCGRVFNFISISTLHADALESNAVFVSPKHPTFHKDAAAYFTTSILHPVRAL